MPYKVPKDYGTVLSEHIGFRNDRDQLNMSTAANVNVTRVRFLAYVASCDGSLSL